MILENISQNKQRRVKYSSLDTPHAQKYPGQLILNLKAKTIEKNINLRISRPQKQRILSENSGPSYDFPVKTTQKQSSRPKQTQKQKLRLVPQAYSSNKTQSNMRQSIQSLQSPIYNLIHDQLIPALRHNRLATSLHPQSLNLSISVLTVLLEKTAISYQSSKASKTHPFDCLHDLITKIGELAENQRIEGKQLKNKIHPVIEQRISFQYPQRDIPTLYQQKNKLAIEINSLQTLQSRLDQATIDKRRHNDQLSSSITDKLRTLQVLREQSLNLQVQIQRYTQMLRQSRQHFEQISHYVDNQTKNKLVRIASQEYKEIESELYEYAVYLQANELATSKDYQSIPMMNQVFAIEKLEQELKGLNRVVIQDESVTLQNKSRMLRDFLIRCLAEFKRKDHQQEKLLQFKTNCIRKFVSMMKRWLDNWTLKQEYLVSLREEFSANAPVCLASIVDLEKDFEGSKEKLKGIYGAVEKLVENYKLGNSFY